MIGVFLYSTSNPDFLIEVFLYSTSNPGFLPPSGTVEGVDRVHDDLTSMFTGARCGGVPMGRSCIQTECACQRKGRLCANLPKLHCHFGGYPARTWHDTLEVSLTGAATGLV